MQRCGRTNIDASAEPFYRLFTNYLQAIYNLVLFGSDTALWKFFSVDTERGVFLYSLTVVLRNEEEFFLCKGEHF